MTRSEAAVPESAFEPRDITGMLDLPTRAAADGDPVDALVEQIITEELVALRRAFVAGAEYAVTHVESPQERMIHRLECPSLEPHLDRRSRWTAGHRRRLHADQSYRLALPALVTRQSARGLSGVRSCKVCWPNVHGTEPHPLRSVQARGLGANHVGHMLSTKEGSSLGTIVSSKHQTGPNLFGELEESIEVVTTARTVRYAPTDPVHIWDLPTDEEAIRRKAQLVERFGQGFMPTV